MLGTYRFSNLFAKFAAATALVTVVLAGLGFSFIAPAAAANTIYYVDCAAGNDANNGTSTTTPWRTMARANQQTYGAGDQILFKRGTTCSGVGFKPVGNGTVASPVTIADYGTGNLPILDGNGNHESAIQLYNKQNYVVRNLELTQHNQLPIIDTNRNLDDQTMVAIVDIRGLGPVNVVSCGEPCTARNITLDGLNIHGGQWNGIYISGGLYDLKSGPTYGYVDNVLIQNTQSWGNIKIGVDVTSTYTKAITYDTTNVTIRTSYLHDNGWDGIRMGPVDHGLIDSNECSYNGSLENARLGCWTWDSHDTVMQFNNSHHNTTPSNPKDGRDAGGFDCDLGSEDCVMQYNWSHDNLGEGFLLMTWPIGFGYARGESHNIHMRYNIGERDGKYLGSSVFFFGFTNPGIVYNNTIYYEPARAAGSTAYQAEGAAIDFSKWGKSGVPKAYIYNNIFINNGTVNPNAVSNLVRDESGCTCTFDNNLYYRVEGGVRMVWGGTTYTTFAAWQASGRDANGLNANPLFTGAFGGGPAAYHLSATSPAINRAQVVTVGLRGMGPRDYFGTTTPVGGVYDIGADEY